MTDPAYKAFRKALSASVAETILWWVRNHPGQQMAPETLTGLCPRRFPLTRDGKTHINLDERLWQLGRRTA